MGYMPISYFCELDVFNWAGPPYLCEILYLNLFVIKILLDIFRCMQYNIDTVERGKNKLKLIKKIFKTS